MKPVHYAAEENHLEAMDSAGAPPTTAPLTHEGVSHHAVIFEPHPLRRRHPI